MAGEAHTAGELRMATMRAEAVYGTIQTGALSYIGSPISLKNDSDHNIQFENGPGSRDFIDASFGPYKVGFTLKYRGRASGTWGDWRNFLALYAFGSTSGLTDHLGAFTYVNYVISRAKYEIYPGAKIDKATVTLSERGRFIDFEAKCLALAHLRSASKALSTYQNVTIGADPSTPTEALLYWNTEPQLNVGSGLANFYPKRLSLSVDNKLMGLPGIKTWYDGTKYPTNIEHHEDERTITAEIEQLLKDDTWDGYMEDHTAITALTIPIDDDVITLSGGKFIPNSLSELQQKLGNQQVTMRFNNLTIA